MSLMEWRGSKRNHPIGWAGPGFLHGLPMIIIRQVRTIRSKSSVLWYDMRIIVILIWESRSWSWYWYIDWYWSSFWHWSWYWSWWDIFPSTLRCSQAINLPTPLTRLPDPLHHKGPRWHVDSHTTSGAGNGKWEMARNNELTFVKLT